MEQDIRELHHRAMEIFVGRVHGVADDQWASPTPCAEWNVRALVNHVVSEMRWEPPLLAGQTIAEVGDRLDGDLLGDDPRAAWDEASGEAARAVSELTSVDRIVHLSFGDVPAQEYLSQTFADLLIHGWDLARGIEANDTLDAELVAACAEWFAEREEIYRSAGVIGDRPGVPDGADPATALLARFGRTA